MQKFGLIIYRFMLLGCTPVLLVADCVILAVIALDIIRAYTFNVTVPPTLPNVVNSLLHSEQPLVLGSVATILAVSIILPFCVASVQIVTPTPQLLHIYQRRIRMRIFLCHMVICVLIVPYCVGWILDLQSAIAFEFSLNNTPPQFLFEPYYPRVLGTLSVQNVIGKTVVGLVISIIVTQFIVVKFLSTDSSADGWALGRRVASRLRALEFDERRVPAYLSVRANWFDGGITPTLQVVCEGAENVVKKYDRLGPGSDRSARYLREELSRVRQLIRELILGDQHQKHVISVFPGTTRALEVAILRCNAERIIISPLEHPAERNACIWVGANTNTPVIDLSVSGSPVGLTTEWNERDYCKTVFEPHLGAGRNLLIISEVDFRTGRRIDIGSVMRWKKEWNKKYGSPDRSVEVIIDGAHAIGNIDRRISGKEHFAYVFSGHKWLGASEPCGVLIMPKERTSLDTVSYDELTDTLSMSTASPRMIGALRYALESIKNQGGIERRMKMSLHHRRRFIELIRDYCRPVVREDAQITGLCLIIPQQDFMWKYDTRELLEKRCIELGIGVQIIELPGDGQYCRGLRIAFAPWLQDESIVDLSGKIRTLVKRVK